MKVLVCGGRSFSNWRLIGEVLKSYSPSEIIQGGATGADEYARTWAESMRIKSTTVRADWKQHGRAAGPIRNQRMLDELQPDLVIAFPGGAGTADMVRRARKGCFKVVEVTE